MKSLSAFLAALALGMASQWSAAGEFVINPLQVTLDRVKRASEVVVRNEDSAPLRMQVEAMAWIQDEAGQDRYEAADGLLYFPRVLEIPPGESRMIRIGVKAAPVTREETYRLFIEELPTPGAAATAGTSLRVLLRVGVAVFVAPAQQALKGAIGSLAVRGGEARWSVANEGNVHFRAERVTLEGFARDGERVFSQPFSERYFLPGVTKALTLAIPTESCRRLATIEAAVLAEGLELRRRLDVDAAACQ